ncbi:MAG TPA: GNAT family N-acetyltransferase [Acidimicrobiales bacterium]|nr:GNAT family N-acetyltransferase [Acidimicrobiales bacterium]
MIRPPRSAELERLRAIEIAAGQAFLDVGMPEIAADEPPPLDALERYLADGWAWVITVGDSDPDETEAGPTSAQPIGGYVIVDVLDDVGPLPTAAHAGAAPTAGARAAHVEQVSVDPRHARRGLGRRLLDHVVEEARRRGFDAVTLTTFRDVPWNAPYYRRCGFRVLADEEIGPGLRRVRDHETALGLDPARRVCMRRDLDGS